jgi:ABC-type Fe3+/spermidine/putrescine transport system ATPase subunit
MNGGRVEQIGSPREIYERPETAFVADFIGSLNALEVTVDELVGAYGVARLAEGERVVVQVDSGVRVGWTLRVAVRPERIQIGPHDAPPPDAGSWLDGSIAEIVYLGMYTQLHVETRAGRLICHRIAGEPADSLAQGSRVRVSWQPEHGSVLAS